MFNSLFLGCSILFLQISLIMAIPVPFLVGLTCMTVWKFSGPEHVTMYLLDMYISSGYLAAIFYSVYRENVMEAICFGLAYMTLYRLS